MQLNIIGNPISGVGIGEETIYGESNGTNTFDIESPLKVKVKVIQALSDRRVVFCKNIFPSSI